jgi:hypothetical protein
MKVRKKLCQAELEPKTGKEADHIPIHKARKLLKSAYISKLQPKNQSSR